MSSCPNTSTSSSPSHPRTHSPPSLARSSAPSPSNSRNRLSDSRATTTSTSSRRQSVLRSFAISIAILSREASQTPPRPIPGPASTAIERKPRAPSKSPYPGVPHDHPRPWSRVIVGLLSFRPTNNRHTGRHSTLRPLSTPKIPLKAATSSFQTNYSPPNVVILPPPNDLYLEQQKTKSKAPQQTSPAKSRLNPLLLNTLDTSRGEGVVPRPTFPLQPAPGRGTLMHRMNASLTCVAVPFSFGSYWRYPCGSGWNVHLLNQ